MTEETLQEKYVREILDPRSALTPRENAAAQEIRDLREKLAKITPTKKAEQDAGKREDKGT